MNSLSLTDNQRKLLLSAMDMQERNESDACWYYFRRNHVTLRPKLKQDGPVTPTPDETRYMLFTLGQIMFMAKTEPERLLRRSLLKKLVELANGETKENGVGHGAGG